VVAAAGLSRIHQISMRAHDVERATRFYRDALGLPFLFAAPPRLAFFELGE
jgi:catechol 2,3-dioxygenase-like lactoylglutathione lyase family enzyme